ncbi:MAG: hypothetical protein ACI3X1_06725 [Eubacteriales bacterium]
MRKFFALLLASLLLCTLLTACTKDEEETAEPVVGGLDEETGDYYVPEPDDGEETKNYELGGVPLT